MFRSLLSNTLVSAVAFAIVGLVGLLLVPVLVTAYGVAGLGMIMLARLFLPGVGIGLFEFGVSEIATQTLAVGRVDDDWERVHRRLALLAAMTTGTALIVGLPLAAFAPQLANVFSVPVAATADFEEVLRCTAMLLPILFLSMMLEGCLKGFDGFRALRLAEVSSAIAYAGAAAAFAMNGADYKWIVYSHLGSLVLRAAMMTMSLRKARASLRLTGHPRPEDKAYMRERASLFFTSRFLGTVLHQSPTILIGLFVGPGGVGLYDTLARLPRFAKSVLGVLNTTLLPYATRLDAAGDDARLKLLLSFGLTLLPAIVFPPLAAVAAVSQGLLGVWIGPQFAANGPWLALFWALPALNTVVSFQNYVLMSRSSYMQASNRLTVAQILVQLAISLALLGPLSQFAFVAGYVGATAALFVWQLSLMHREVHLPGQNIQRLAAYGAVLASMVAAMHFVDAIARPGGWIPLGLAALAVWGVLAAVTYALFLGREERAMLTDIAAMLRRRKKNHIPSAKD